MDLKNVIAISCRTNTGEMFEVPVREFFGLDPAQNSLGIGVIPKSDGKAFIASDVTEGANGQLTFKNYKSETSFTGIPVGILAFDANGRVVTVPFQQNQTSPKTTTQESPSSSVQSTINKLPIWTDNNGDLGDSDITRDGESYSVGGTMPFWKWDVYQGSVNITQSSISDGFRLNGKLVVSYDPNSEELTIGNSVYTTTNIQHINTHSISFNTSPSGIVPGVGVLSWNDTDGTLEFGMKGGNVTQQIGQELPVLVKHADNTGLTNGAVVYVVGSDGSNKTVRYALANAESTSSKTFGVMTENATGGNKAFCTTFGLVRNIDTSALTEGAAVYLSPTVAGGMTTTKPTAPNHMVLVGFCVRSHATVGSIFVKIINGFELNEIHDVAIGTLANNNLLAYESATSLWKNKTYSELGIIAASGLTAGYIPKYDGTGFINSSITDSGTVITVPNILVSGLTTSQLVATDASKNLVSLSTDTYPSLTEVSYIKGLTSSAQAQINGKQPLDADLTAIAAISATSGLLKKTAADTWELDTSVYITGNQTITLSGVVTGSGTTAITTAIADDALSIAKTSGLQSALDLKFATPTGLTTNYVTKWNGTALANSLMFDNGTNVGIGTTSPTNIISLGNGAARKFWIENSATDVVGRALTVSAGGTVAGTSVSDVTGGNLILQAGLGTGTGASTISFQTGTTLTTGTTLQTMSTKMTINGAGSVGIGTVNLTGYNLRIGKNITGAASSFGIAMIGSNVGADATTQALGFYTGIGVVASATIPTLNHYVAGQASFNSSTVTTQFGFLADASIIGATTNVGFRGEIPSGTNRWNLSMTGTAQNHFRGNVGIGLSSTVPATELEVRGVISASLGSAALPSHTFVGDLNNGWWSPAADTQAWSLSGAEVMRLNSTGLGIGVTPSYKLDVSGTGHFTGAVTFDTVPSSLQDATTSNHLVRYSQWIASTSVKYLPTAVKTVSLTNITLSGTQTVNGVALIAGDRILVAGQTTGANNGVYDVAAGSWTRSTDSDTDSELRGYIINISNGTYSGYKYINTNGSTITVGTTAITYSEFSNVTEIDPVFVAWRDGTRTANTFWAAPNGSNGAATWRALVAADVPTLNQSTTGSAATLTTSRNIAISGDLTWNVDFNGSAAVTAVGTLATISDSGAGSFLKIIRNTKGLVTGTVAVAQADITGLLGASSITNIMLSDSGVAAGTYRSVTVNAKGIVTGGTNPSIALGSEVSGILPIANGGIGSNTQNFVDLSTTQSSIGGAKTFTELFTVNNRVYQTGLGGSTYFGQFAGAADDLTSNNNVGLGNRALQFITSGSNNVAIGYEAGAYKNPFPFGGTLTTNTNSIFIGKSSAASNGGTNEIVIGHNSIGAGSNTVTLGYTSTTANFLFGTVKYGTLLKPNNVAGTDGQFLRTNGTQDAWATLTTTDISNLSSYTGFNSVYAPISHTLDSHSNVTITSNSSGEILKWNGSAWINNTLTEAGIQATLTSGTSLKTVATQSLLGSGDITIASLNYWTKAGSDLYAVGANVYAPYFEANGAIVAFASTGTDNYTVLGVGSTSFQQKVYDVTNQRLETISSAGVLGTIFNGGNYRFGTGTDSGLAKVQVVGAIQQSSVTNAFVKANTNGVFTAGILTTSDISNLSSWTGSTSITTLSTIATGTWNGTVIGYTYGGTGLTALGTAGQLLKVNAGATALEYFTPTYISANQTITLSGIITGSGTTAITTSIADATLSIAKTSGLQSALDGKQATISGTGIVKSTGGTISYLTDNSSNWNTSFGWGNHASAGYLTTSTAASTYQTILPSGTTGQFLIRNASADLEFFNLELEPTRLTKNKIAVGDSANYLSDYENFEFLESRFINILKVDDSTKAVSFGMYGASSNSFISASGGSLTVRGDNGLIFSNFAGGGTLALTVDNDGKVGVTPLGTGGGSTPTLASTYIGYGSSGNALTGTSNFVYDAIKTAVYFNDSANYLYVGKSVSVSDMFEITAVGARGIQLNTDTDIVIKNNNHLYLGSGASNKRVHIGRGASYNDANHYLVINGETFSFSMDNVPGWGDTNSESTPQVGDKILFNVVDIGGGVKRFVPQKINKKLFSTLTSGDTILTL